MVVVWGLLLGLCIGIIITYAHTMGWKVSSDGSDWAAFGALLSGTFGMLASFTALATLFIVILQLRTQETITEKQLQAIEFDRYDRHRRIFFERLEELEIRHDGRFKFYNKEDLYGKIFPNNSPLHCDVKAPILSGEESVNFGITKIYEILDDIKDRLKNPLSIDRNLIFWIMKLQGEMKIEMVGEPIDGDVMLDGRERTIVNLYELDETLRILDSCFNSLSEYAGNGIMIGWSSSLVDGNIKREMIKLSHKIERAQIGSPSMKLHSRNSVKFYAELFVVLENIIKKGSRTKRIDELYHTIESVLIDSKFRNECALESGFIGNISYEVLVVSEDASVDDASRSMLKIWYERLNNNIDFLDSVW